MPSRPTPYPNFRFKVMWDNTYVLGASRVSGLSRFPDGGGPTAYSPITIERGVSYDATFGQWANKVFDGTKANAVDFRRDLTIEVYDEAGMKVVAYQVHRAWVSQFSAMSELDGVGNALVVDSMTLQNDGFERVEP